MKRLSVIALLIICSAGVGFAATGAKRSAAKATQSGAARAQMLGHIQVMRFPSEAVAVVEERASDYTPPSGYRPGMAGIGEAYSAMVGDAFTKINTWFISGGKPTGRPFAVLPVDPTSTTPSNLACKVGVPTVANVRGKGAVKIEKMPAMRYAAVARFRGPYDGSMNVWNALGKWVPEHGYKPAGPPVEVYIVGPGDKVPPGEYVTEIRVPLQRTSPPMSAKARRAHEAKSSQRTH